MPSLTNAQLSRLYKHHPQPLLAKLSKSITCDADSGAFFCARLGDIIASDVDHVASVLEEEGLQQVIVDAINGSNIPLDAVDQWGVSSTTVVHVNRTRAELFLPLGSNLVSPISRPASFVGRG